MATQILRTGAKEKGPGIRMSRGEILSYVLLGLWALISVMPFWLSTVYALMPKEEIFAPPTLLPNPFSLNNFQAIFSVLESFPKWLFNSIVIALVVMSLRLVFCCAAGYSFARINFPGRELIFGLLLFSMTLPGIVTIIPKYLMMNSWDQVIRETWLGDQLDAWFQTNGKLFIGTAMAIIIPEIAPAAQVFMARQFYKNFPTEVEESAMLDGLSKIGAFFRIALPMSLPLLISMGVLVFQGSWNDFQWPNIVLNREETFTLPLGLSYLRGQYNTIFSYVLAGSLFNSIPIIIIFLVFQRFFVSGLQSSGSKEA
jgi:multiple sugar transport system permease protein